VGLLAWIATVLILISKACGTGMNSKGFAGCMYKSTWVFVVNAVLFLFFLISACILATNAKRFDLGSVRKEVLLLFDVFSLRTHHSEIAERCKK
jgi:hypothetical protein